MGKLTELEFRGRRVFFMGILVHTRKEGVK